MLLRLRLRRDSFVVFVALLALTLAACGPRQRPVLDQPLPPPDLRPIVEPPPPPPPSASERIGEGLPVPLEPLLGDEIADRSLDDINRDSPLQPVFFALDTFELDAAGRQAAGANAEVLKRFPAWQVTIEGHCDERGTAEYNLALGDRRALAVKTYLVSLGIAPDRIRTVSYGKEFPFAPGSHESAWTQNRRAHFVVTAK